jgi:hypothetical protein
MKHMANKLVDQLAKDGIQAEAIHGNKSQPARQRALENFRSGPQPRSRRDRHRRARHRREGHRARRELTTCPRNPSPTSTASAAPRAPVLTASRSLSATARSAIFCAQYRTAHPPPHPGAQGPSPRSRGPGSPRDPSRMRVPASTARIVRHFPGMDIFGSKDCSLPIVSLDKTRAWMQRMKKKSGYHDAVKVIRQLSRL